MGTKTHDYGHAKDGPRRARPPPATATVVVCAVVVAIVLLVVPHPRPSVSNVAVVSHMSNLTTVDVLSLLMFTDIAACVAARAVACCICNTAGVIAKAGCETEGELRPQGFFRMYAGSSNTDVAVAARIRSTSLTLC